jgi:hypothetical protein
MADEGGARAVSNGKAAQTMIRGILTGHGYTPAYVPSLKGLLNSKATLWPTSGQFAPECRVPLTAPCHRGRERSVRVDFLVLTKLNEAVVLSVKSQDKDGTADEKLEYEIRQLMSTGLPAAMVVIGPVRGRDGPTGWREHILQNIWDRILYEAGARVFLFRDTERVTRWIHAGMPVGGQGTTPSQVWAEFCDREP